MSHPIDDKPFEEYLSRESQLSKRYRALGAEEVPPELDSLVLAQARQAVAAQPASLRKKPAWMRWTPPLALAASMVLAISIVIESGTKHEVAMRDMAASMPQSPPAPEAVGTDSDDAAQPETDALADTPQALQMQARQQTGAGPRRDPVIGELKKSVMPPAEIVVEAHREAAEARSAAVAVEMPPPAMKVEVPAPVSGIVTAGNSRNAPAVRHEAVAAVEREAVSVEEVAITGSRVQRTRGPGQGAGPRGTVMSPIAGSRDQVSEEALVQRFRESDPQRWLEYIRELRRDDKGGQADREWRNFLKAYPDYTVDEKDVARARQ